MNPEQIEQQWDAVMSGDPQLQALRQQLRSTQGPRGYQNPQQADAVKQQIAARVQTLAQQHNLPPLPENYRSNQWGNATHDNWFERNSDWLLPAIAGGAIGGMALAGAGSAGGASGAATAGTGAATVPAATTGIVPGTVGTTIPSVTGATGGGILGTLRTLGQNGLGRMLSAGAEGLASGRREDAQINARAIAENNRALADVARFNLDAPQLRTQQAARGELLATMQDAPSTGDARVDKWAGGGLRPSAFGPQSRQAGSELSRQALMALMSGSDRITPQPIPTSTGGLGENLMAGAGLGFNLLDTLDLLGGRRPTQGASVPGATPPITPQPVSSNINWPRF